MAYVAYKQLLWSTGGDGLTRFDPNFADSANLVRMDVSDDDAVLNGFASGDADQQITFSQFDGTLIDSSAGGPFLRYALAGDDGNTYSIDMVVLSGSGELAYLVPEPPPEDVGFTIDGMSFVGGDGGAPEMPYELLDEFNCFAPDTQVLTPDGWHRIDRIGAGDLVVTRDAGTQPVLWAGGANVFWDQSRATRPITLTDHSCLTGTLFAPLTLSAHHRVLMTGPQIGLLFDTPEVFAPAAGLGRGPGGRGHARWHHLMFASHQIICANGVWVESLLATPRSVGWLSLQDAAEVLGKIGRAMDPARPCLTLWEAQTLRNCAGTGSQAA